MRPQQVSLSALGFSAWLNVNRMPMGNFAIGLAVKLTPAADVQRATDVRSTLRADDRVECLADDDDRYYHEDQPRTVSRGLDADGCGCSVQSGLFRRKCSGCEQLHYHCG